MTSDPPSTEQDISPFGRWDVVRPRVVSVLLYSHPPQSFLCDNWLTESLEGEVLQKDLTRLLSTVDEESQVLTNRFFDGIEERVCLTQEWGEALPSLVLTLGFCSSLGHLGTGPGRKSVPCVVLRVTEHCPVTITVLTNVESIEAETTMSDSGILRPEYKHSGRKISTYLASSLSNLLQRVLVTSSLTDSEAIPDPYGLRQQEREWA